MGYSPFVRPRTTFENKISSAYPLAVSAFQPIVFLPPQLAFHIVVRTSGDGIEYPIL